MDSHADTIVAGHNCVILAYTGRVCDVSPYRDDYESVKDIPIMQAATAWQSQHTGQTYILVFNEALWMGDSMDHSLVNPNQLRHYGTEVQDNPMSNYPLSIQTEDKEFCMELMMEGTIIYANTHSPSEEELHSCPMIHLSSSHPWDPEKVKFPECRMTLEEHFGGMRYLSDISSQQQIEDKSQTEESLFSIEVINRAICSMRSTNPKELLSEEQDKNVTAPFSEIVILILGNQTFLCQQLFRAQIGILMYLQKT